MGYEALATRSFMRRVAGKRGIEPLLPEPESGVLPLDDFPTVLKISQKYTDLARFGVQKGEKMHLNNDFMKKGMKKIVGIALIIGGVVGLFLPFFQGIAMIVAGGLLLENKWITDRVNRLTQWWKARN